MFRSGNSRSSIDATAAGRAQDGGATSESSTGVSRRTVLKAGGLFGIGGVPLLAACGRGSGSESTGRYTMWSMSDTVDIMRHFVKKYKRTVDNEFDVRVTEIPTGLSLRAKIISASAANRLPDVLDLSMNYGSDFAAYNMFEPLNDVVPNDLAAKTSMYRRVWDWVDTKNIPAFEGDDHIFGVPYAISVFVPAYRADLLRKANAEFPEDWDTLIEMGKKLTTAPKRFALSVPTSGDLMDEFHPFLMQAGAQYVNDDLTEAFPNREMAYRGFEFYRDICIKHRISPKQSPDRFASDPVQRLSSGQVAMTTLPMWSIDALKKSAPDLEFGPEGNWFVGKFWKGPAGRGGYFNANALHVKRGVKNVQPLADFATWMLEPEQQEEMYNRYTRTPMNMKTWKKLEKDPAFKVYTDSIEFSKRQGGFKGWKLAEFVIDRSVERVVIGGEKVRPVVDETAKDMLQAIQNA